MFKSLLIAVLLTMSSLALAQNQGQIVPSGRFTPGHTARCQNSTCTVAVDGGGAAGSNINGQGYLTELGITNTGTPFCISDALINAVGGYHQLCIGANGLGGGLISYNPIGGASPLGLNFNINGATYPFPGNGNGNVTGPTPSVVGHLAIFNNISGSLLADSPNLSLSPTLTIGSPPYVPSFSSIYMSSTASGTMSNSNTLAVPAGHVWPVNLLQCSDTATAPGGSALGLDCLTINALNLGAGTGDRNGLDINMTINGSAAQTPGNAFFNGGIVTVNASANLGGGSGTEIGDVYGWSTQMHLMNGATHYAGVHGMGEWDLEVQTGASVINKIGAELALTSLDAVHGANIDAAMLFSNTGSASWGILFALGFPIGQGGSFPVAATGTIMASYQAGAAAAGINFSNITFSGCAFATATICARNNSLTIGSQTLVGGNTVFETHTGTDDNFLIVDGSSGDLGSGILVDILNDSASAFRNFEIQAANIQMTPSVQMLVAGKLNLGGVTGAGASARTVCVDNTGLVLLKTGAC